MMSIVRIVAAVYLSLLFGGSLFAQAKTSTRIPAGLVANETLTALGPLDRPARLSVEDVSLATGLSDLQDGSGISLVYSPSKLPRDHRVTCKCYRLKVGAALDRLLSGTGMQYSVVEPHVLIEPKSLPLPQVGSNVRLAGTAGPGAFEPRSPIGRIPLPLHRDNWPAETNETKVRRQLRMVSGRVVDATTGAPLAAQVSVKGTSMGELAGADGTFSLEVPSGDATLVVRLIGYKTNEVLVPGDQNSVQVALETDVLNLDEIVVTGRATSVARRNLANAVATVSGEELTEVAASSLEQQLQGKVAGANIQSNSGAPGGGLQVQLRGVSSIIGQSTPLYVVDGVIVSDATIPSGVHVITRSSSNPIVGGSQDNSANRISDLNPNDIASVEILKGASAAAIYGSKANNGVIIITTKRGATGTPRYSLSTRLGYSELANKLGTRRFETLDDAVAAFGETAEQYWAPGRYFDHEEQLAGNRPLAYEIAGSASGGAENTQYFLSGLVLDEGGIITNTGYQKQSLRLNLNQQLLNGRLQVDVNTNAIHSAAARGFTNNDNRNISYWMTFPYTPSFVDLQQNADGSWPNNPFSNSNPLETAALAQNDEIVWRFIGSTSVEYEALRSATQLLQLVGTGGIDYFNQKNELLTPAELQFEPLDGLSGTSLLATAYNQNLNLGLNVVHTLTPTNFDLSATTSVGTQFEIYDLDFARTTTQNLIGGQSNVDRGTTVNVLQQRERVEDLGLFVQEDVLIGDRLLLTASVRADKSSNNGETDQFYWYPKAAGSYRFPGLIPGTIDDLKFRIAYGESGNRPKYGQKFTEYVGQNIAGIPTVSVSGTTAAPDLRPERQREIEAGIDATFFDERATLQLTGYQKDVTDVLLQRQLPTSSGFSTAIFNGGEFQVRGIEAALSVVPISTTDLQWVSRTNFSANRSEMVDLPVPPFVTGGFGFLFGAFFVDEGESLTSIWGNATLEDGSTGLAPLGDANPDFKVGFSNDLTYRNLNLYALLDWQQGGTVDNLTQLLYDLARNTDDCGVMIEGESACVRRSRLWPTTTSVYLYDTSFLKLRELRLSMELPSSLTQRLLGNARSARFSLSGRNLFTWTDYPGLDPEVSNYGSQAIARNIDVAPYPPSRSFWFSLDLGF